MSGGPDPLSVRRGRQAGSGIAAAAGMIAVLTLLARATGFARWFVFSGSVGTTCVGNVYNAANTLPNVLYEVAAGGVLAAVAVPLIARALSRGDETVADRIASALLTWAVTLLVPLAALLFLLATPISELLLVRTSQCPGAQQLGADMIRVFAPQVPLYGIGIVLAGVLQAHRRFLAAALAPLLSSLVVICAYLLYGALAHGRGDDLAALPPQATLALTAGTTLGVAALSLPLFGPVLRAGVRLRPAWRFPDGVAGRARGLAGAGLLALVAQQVAVMVTVLLAANHGATGSLTVYQYIQAVYLLPYAVLAVPVAISTFPALVAEDVAGEDVAGTDAAGAGASMASGATAAPAVAAPTLAAPTLARSARAVVLAMGLGAGVLVAVAGPVASVFTVIDAGRSASAGSTALAAMPSGLVAFAPGLLGFGLMALLTRALYVRGRPALAGRWVAAGWLLAALGSLTVLVGGTVSSRRLLVSLGVASTLGMTLAAVGLVLTVRSAWGATALAGLTRSLAASVVGGAAAGLAGAVVAGAVPASGLTASVGAGVLAASLTLVVFVVVVAAGDRESGRLLLGRLRRSQA
jgi:putative peptidoglycan lipid II flippase